MDRTSLKREVDVAVDRHALRIGDRRMNNGWHIHALVPYMTVMAAVIMVIDMMIMVTVMRAMTVMAVMAAMAVMLVIMLVNMFAVTMAMPAAVTVVVRHCGHGQCQECG